MQDIKSKLGQWFGDIVHGHFALILYMIDIYNIYIGTTGNVGYLQVTVFSFAVTQIQAVLRCWGGFLNLLCWPCCFRLSADSAAGTWFQSYLQALDTRNLCLTIPLAKSGDRQRNPHYLNSVNNLWNLLLRLPQNRVAVSSQPACRCSFCTQWCYIALWALVSSHRCMKNCITQVVF